MSDQAHREEYALTASLLPHVLAVRVSYPDDPENPAPGVVGSLVRDGELWRVYGVPSPSMPLSQAVLSLVMGHQPERAGTQSMALADRALSAYLTANPALNYTEAHVVDGYPVTLTRPGGSKYFRLLVTGSHDAYFEDLGTARGAIPSEVKSAKLEHQSHLAPDGNEPPARPAKPEAVSPSAAPPVAEGSPQDLKASGASEVKTESARATENPSAAGAARRGTRRTAGPRSGQQAAPRGRGRAR